MKFRDIIKEVEADGWRLARQKGSHKHFVHPTKQGIVTIAGQPGKEVKAGTLSAILRQAGLKKVTP